MAPTPSEVTDTSRTSVANTAQHTPVANAPRRKPGRGSQVMPDERREIQRMHLVEGLNQRQLADRFGRTRETIAKQLQDDDFQAVKREVHAEMAVEARSTLRGHVRVAAKDWVTASRIAAKRGDHKPAKDLLMHAGVIERLGDTAGSQVTVLVGMPGRPAMLPPTQAEIDAATVEGPVTIGVTTPQQQAPLTIDVTAAGDPPQPRLARLEAPKLDT